MHSFIITFAAALVPQAAFVRALFPILSSVPDVPSILERQDVEPGTPAYECHYDCGYAIVGAQTETSYCTNSTWEGLLDGCLECAETQDIWQYYGDDVTSAAEACGLSAEPSPSSSSVATSTSVTPTVTGAITSSIAETTPSSSPTVSIVTSGVASTPTTAISATTVVSSVSALATAVSSVTTGSSTTQASNSSSSAIPSAVVVAGADIMVMNRFAAISALFSFALLYLAA